MNKKFLKPNKENQVPILCVNFNSYGRHCWISGDYETNACDCVVLQNKKCKNYKIGKGGKC